MKLENIKVSNYIDVSTKLKNLNLNVSDSIIILPYNFDELSTKEEIGYTLTDSLTKNLFINGNVKTDFLTANVMSKKDKSFFCLKSEIHKYYDSIWTIGITTNYSKFIIKSFV